MLSCFWVPQWWGLNGREGWSVPQWQVRREWGKVRRKWRVDTYAKWDPHASAFRVIHNPRHSLSRRRCHVSPPLCQLSHFCLLILLLPYSQFYVLVQWALPPSNPHPQPHNIISVSKISYYNSQSCWLFLLSPISFFLFICLCINYCILKFKSA